MFMEIVEIGALTIVAIFIFMIGSSWYYSRKLKNGTMKPIQQVEYISGIMQAKLKNFKSDASLGKLKSIAVLDEYIEKQLSIYPAENILNDRNFILECGSFLGAVIKARKSFSWKFRDDIPMLVKRESYIYPFELVKEKIMKGASFSLYEYVYSL